MKTSSRIYQAAMSSGNGKIIGTCDPDRTEQGLKPFSDLVITLNEAVIGVPAKHLIDAFQSSTLPLCHSSSLAAALHRPLLVAVHSKSDALWTGKTATVLRRFVWWPNGGHDLGSAFPKEDVDGTHPSKLLTYFATPPNMTGLPDVLYQ